MPRNVIDDLHRVRLDRDLSYDALAAELNMSRPNVFRLMTERGARVTDRTLHKIRRYLVSADERASA